MITAEKIVYDIRRAIKEFNVGQGSLEDSYLYHKVDTYAEMLKRTEYDAKKTIDKSWILNLGKVDTELVNSGDDPASLNGSVVFAKFNIPKLIQFGSSPYIRISGGLRVVDYTKLDSFSIFYAIYNSDRKVLEQNPVYILTTDAVYIYPTKTAISISLIPFSPFDCMIKKPLIDPISGSQIHNGLISRPFSKWDQYPISGDLSARIVFEYMTKEFSVSSEKMQDFTQNGTKEE